MKKIIKKLKKISALALSASLIAFHLLSPAMALAEEIEQPTEINFDQQEHNNDSSFNVGEILSAEGQEQSYLEDENAPVLAFILDVINFISRVIGAISMLIIILSGLMMIVSEGDEGRLEKGKGMFASALIGLVIALFSYMIVRFFQSIFYLA